MRPYDTIRSQLELFSDVFRQYMRGIYRGRYPRWRSGQTLIRQAGQEDTFSGKLARRLLLNREQILSTISDKLLSRDYVSSVIGAHVLPRIYQVVDAPEKIDWNSLPTNYVIKLNHGSGGLLVIGDFPNSKPMPWFLVGSVWPKYLVDFPTLNKRRVNRFLNHLLQRTYEYGPNKYQEWAYGQIRPKIIIEEFLSEPNSKHPPRDYKFFCFNGKCRLVQVDSDRFYGHTRQMFDLDWSLMPFDFVYPSGNTTSDRPNNLELMIQIAEKLASAFDFIRVDLYSIGDRVYFGELSCYPEGGLGRFDPPEWDAKIGALWRERL